jgi:uncharacterized protein YehS (DUF1456 family)
LTNNDVLRRIRYTFNYNDEKMMAIFLSAELEVTREQISYWLKKDDDSDFVNCGDTQLAIFLNGLINEKRGKKPGVQAIPEKRINNNIILTKLKIAFNLKSEDIIALFAKENLTVSKPELSAFSRKPDHKHYRECKDQFLRNFLQGLDHLYHVKRRAKIQENKDQAQTEHKETPKTTYGTAKPKASNIYLNPNRTVVEKPKPERKVLKLKPEQIWGK